MDGIFRCFIMRAAAVQRATFHLTRLGSVMGIVVTDALLGAYKIRSRRYLCCERIIAVVFNGG
jgi:hypothetical protein